MSGNKEPCDHLSCVLWTPLAFSHHNVFLVSHRFCFVGSSVSSLGPSPMNGMMNMQPMQPMQQQQQPSGPAVMMQQQAQHGLMQQQPSHMGIHMDVSGVGGGVGGGGAGVRACAGCGGKILERFLFHALDRFWHHGCLKCSCCGARLADIGVSCYTKAGMILCRADYVR